jgi:hypothetical protein
MEPLPEINLNLKPAKDTAKKTANQAKSSLKAAGSLVAKKAERTKLVTVTLPRAYVELGKSVYKDASHRDEFLDLFQSVENFLAERKRIAEEVRARPAGTTVTEKAKKVAADAADIARTKAIDLQAFQAFANLGEAVYRQYGGDAGPAQLVEPIAFALTRREQLDREVQAINVSAKGDWITPKRIVWGFGILLGLAVLGSLADGEKKTPARQQTTPKKGNVRTLCPACGKASDTPARALGTTTTCPGCNATYTLEVALNEYEKGKKDGVKYAKGRKEYVTQFPHTLNEQVSYFWFQKVPEYKSAARHSEYWKGFYEAVVVQWKAEGLPMLGKP